MRRRSAVLVVVAAALPGGASATGCSTAVDAEVSGQSCGYMLGANLTGSATSGGAARR